MASLTCDEVNLHTVHSFLKPNDTNTSSGARVVSYTHDTGHGPVLFLVHGYPQSAFIYRHLATLLKDKVSLFIPELPGYGISTLPQGASGFRAVGQALFESFKEIFPERDFILGGHDRGARICHRLAVDNAHSPSSAAASCKLHGLVMLDIVPTLQQWRVFANPKAATAYFHWPFLASPLAADMIESYGGDKWVHSALSRIGGENDKAVKQFQSDKAWEVYESLFTKRATIEGSCADYAAAAFSEPQMQEEDQSQGRKIEVPTLVMWSLKRLGQMHGDLRPIWRPWIKEGVELQTIGCGENVGHYLPEEATEFIFKTMVDFIQGMLN